MLTFTKHDFVATTCTRGLSSLPLSFAIPTRNRHTSCVYIHAHICIAEGKKGRELYLVSLEIRGSAPESASARARERAPIKLRFHVAKMRPLQRRCARGGASFSPRPVSSLGPSFLLCRTCLFLLVSPFSVSPASLGLQFSPFHFCSGAPRAHDLPLACSCVKFH